MTPAERQFADIEEGLRRAQCLVRVLREVTDGGLEQGDKVLWAGVYVITCEAETALDAASELWEEAYRKIERPA